MFWYHLRSQVGTPEISEKTLGYSHEVKSYKKQEAGECTINFFVQNS